MKKEFMNEALRLAEQAFLEGEVPVGAVVTIGNKIIGTGRNRREKGKNALHHAEIEAINEACKRLGGWRLWECELYVTLEPCPMCAGAIINARIKNVVFGAYDKKNGACGSVTNLFESGFSYSPSYEGGFMENECADVLSRFFKGRILIWKKLQVLPLTTQNYSEVCTYLALTVMLLLMI